MTATATATCCRGEGLRPETVATAISDLAADDAIFTVDTGMCNVWGAHT